MTGQDAVGLVPGPDGREFPVRSRKILVCGNPGNSRVSSARRLVRQEGLAGLIAAVSAALGLVLRGLGRSTLSAGLMRVGRVLRAKTSGTFPTGSSRVGSGLASEASGALLAALMGLFFGVLAVSEQSRVVFVSHNHAISNTGRFS